MKRWSKSVNLLLPSHKGAVNYFHGNVEIILKNASREPYEHWHCLDGYNAANVTEIKRSNRLLEHGGAPTLNLVQWATKQFECEVGATKFALCTKS